MRVEILSNEHNTKRKSFDLEQLATEIENSLNQTVERQREIPQTHEKGEGLVMALTIANLALTGIGTLVAVLSFRASQQERCSVSYEKDGKTITHDNLTPTKLRSTLSSIESENNQNIVKILISNNELNS